MDRTRLARHLVRAALAFYEQAPWQRFGSADLVAVVTPGERAPVFASIVGQGSGDPGLCVIRGADAFAACQRLLAGESPDEAVSAADLLTVGFEPPSEISPEGGRLLREAKFAGRIAPQFLAKPPGRRPRPTNREENGLLLSVLEGLLAADAKGLLRPVASPARGRAAVWTLRLSGKPTAPEVRAKFEEYAPSGPPAAPSPVVLPDDVTRLPRTEASWWIALPVLPVQVQDDDRELRALIVFDATNDRILLMRPTFSVGPEEVADELFGVCRTGDGPDPRGRPARVDFDRQALLDALAPALAAAGVDAGLMQEPGRAREIVEEFQAHERSDRAGNEEDEEAGAAEPADDDLAGWKRIDGQLSGLLAKAVEGPDTADRAAGKYFGPEPEMLDTDGDAAAACFGEWLACHFRRNPRSRTAAEGLLAGGSLGPAPRRLLVARAAAPISLYRIVAVTRGEGVELLDVLQGTTARVHDRSLSESAREGMVLFAKVYPAGAFTFVALLSAPLPEDTERTLQWLETQGLKLTPEGLQRSARALGRLWSFRAQRSRMPLRLTNTDGEPLLHIQASFRVRDEAALRQALLRRPDVEEHEAGGELSWFREQAGGRLRLGRLEFVGGELVATVNSEQRLGWLQAWLCAMPGVRALGVSRREFMLPPPDDELPDDEPDGLSREELVEALGEVVRAQSMRWLDETIPALGDLTPRAAVATAEGRRRVARMIRAMPDPIGPAGPIRGAVPREAMLRELGLEREAEGRGEAGAQP